MEQKIKNLKTTTFCGRRLRRQQIADIQKTVNTFTNLSRSEIALTICTHLNLETPRGTDRIHTCLNILEEMEKLGLFTLPSKIEQKEKNQKVIQWTEQSNEPESIICSLEELMPIKLQIITEKKQVAYWNELIDRYHYLGYRRPIGSHLRYFIVDSKGRKLGCILFSFATLKLHCRDQWIGWTEEQRKKHLNTEFHGLNPPLIF